MNHFKTTLIHAAEYIMASARQMAKDKTPSEPIMLHSSPGVGKSAIIHQCGEDLKELFETSFDATFKIWDVRVGAQQESDIQGIPYPATVEVVDGMEIKDMLFSTPMWFPREGECGILLLDELANAPIPNQHACYRLVHDRTIHNGRKLPDGVIVIAAGNTKEDKTGAKAIVPALARRFQAHFFIEPSVEDFLTYAMNRGLHDAVIGFLGYDPSKLVSTAMPGEYGFACPANWESVSNILHNEFMSQELQELGIINCLGSVTGQEFIGFLRNRKYMPDFAKVEETGEYSAPEGADVDRGIMFTVISSTAVRILRSLEEGVDDGKVDNLAAILKAFDISTAGIAFRSMRRANKKAIAKILTGNCPKLKEVLNDVLVRTQAMAG